MTEERFESMYDGAFIKDKIHNRTFCCDEQSDWLDICDLLNNQNRRMMEDFSTIFEIMTIIIEYDTTNKYKNAGEAISAIKKELNCGYIMKKRDKK